jgi:WD40 repeat protein
MSRSIPSWTEQFDGQNILVIKPSSRNDHIVLGSRQFVRTVSLSRIGLTSIRSMKSTTAATAIAFHPTAESVIASAGSNGEVSIWYYGAQNIAPLNEKWTAHNRAIHAMEFLPIPKFFNQKTSAILLTVSADGEINCWDVCDYSGKKETWRKPGYVGNLRSEGLRCGLRDIDVRLHPDGYCYEVVVACDDGSIEYYKSEDLDPSTLELVSRVSISTQTINSVKFNKSLIATGGKDSYIRVFSLDKKSTLNPVCSIRCSSPVWAIRWRPSSNGTEYIAASHSIMDSCIYIWDLESRLMPAYVLNSHRDNVTDFFWADRFHIISCSRDNTVQLNAIKNAIIPLEKMRTVNIAFNVSTLTSVCDRVNREKFEKDHEDLRLEEIRTSGFLSDYVSLSKASVGSSSALKLVERKVRIQSVPFKSGYTLPTAIIAKLVKPLTLFIHSMSTQTDLAIVSKLCEKFGAHISSIDKFALTTQSQCMRLISWLLINSSKNVVYSFLTRAIRTYRDMNDIVMVVALGSVAMYSADHSVASLVDQKLFTKWSKSLLDILRKLELWQQAAEYVFLSPVAGVRQLSLIRTSFNFTCSNCKHELEVPAAACPKCNVALTECSVCRKQVKGMWITCEGCGHGGHLKHMDRWFDLHSICPVPNCGHQCR